MDVEQQGGGGRYDGTDFVCDTCGGEIMVKHTGDEQRMSEGSTYICRCGTPMRPEHGAAQ